MTQTVNLTLEDGTIIEGESFGALTSAAGPVLANTPLPVYPDTPTHPSTAGNGSLMRLAPVPMFFCKEPQRAIEAADASSRPTHGEKTAADA